MIQGKFLLDDEICTPLVFATSGLSPVHVAAPENREAVSAKQPYVGACVAHGNLWFSRASREDALIAGWLRYSLYLCT